ncbi:DNA primase [endosymbiont of Euscepes postfasciatus]|nr:DNA primase [endosymbiont of Euscepes postfasciatus]
MKKNNYNNIDYDFINKIIEYTDIIDILSKYINLTKIGNNYFSICPFHKENNPSFIVNKSKKFYYCFGCKVYGNIINFLIFFKKKTFIEVVNELSSLNGIYINSNNIYKKKYNLYSESMKNINKLYIENLFNKFNFYKLSFFFIKKKWKLNVIKLFNIGYSSHLLINKFLKINKINLNILVNIGILKKKNNNYIDIFYNRLIFPIFDYINGNIIGFGGKNLYKKNLPKYINSSDSKIFKKKNCIYGLYQVKQIYNNNISKLLLVEGYTDVISLFNIGINYAVSSLGCNLTNDQIKILFNNTNELILCYDGDKSGFNSLYNLINKILLYLTDDRRISFIIMPKNEDPDSLLQKIKKEDFINIINSSIDIFDFIFKFYENNSNSFYNKINIINNLIKYIDLIPGKLMKFFFKKKICKKFNIDINELNSFLYKKNENYIYINKFINNPIRILIKFLLDKPELHKLIIIPSELKIINNYEMIIFLKIIFICYKYNINKNLLLFFKNYKYFNYLYKISKINILIKNDNNNKIFLHVLNKVYLLLYYNNYDNIIKKIKSIKLLNDIDKKYLIFLNKKILKLSKNFVL